MEIAGAIVSKIAECTVELAIRQGRYLFRFNEIVEDLNEGETNLRSKRERMVSRVKSAEDNNEQIYEDVKTWLIDSSIVLDDVQRLNAEIEEKRSCLNGWCCRYCLSRKAVKKTSIMLKRVDEYGKIEVVGKLAPLPGVEFSAPKDCELFRSSKAAFDQIIEALRNDEIDLVGLYGMGGLGKTTLAKMLAIEVKKRGIFDEVVMVAVSQAPNFKDMQIKLARSLGVELKEEDEEERAKQLYLRLTNTNTDTKKKILVILDDFWKKFDLKATIGFPFGENNKHCKILLTTRRKQLCAVIGCQSQILLGLLNTNEGLTLLKRYAGINEAHITSELKALVIQVAGECNGLPLAITTIGRALKEKSIDEWKLVFEKLKKSKLDDVYDILDVDDKDVYACLKLSYDYLRDEDTKFCFLLCSLFPEDYEISEEELVVCGIGLGLFSDADLIEDAKSRLRVMLNSLKDSCLLLDLGKDCVKMHDIVRDVALWIASKGKNVFMSRYRMGPIEWSKEKGWEQHTAMSLLSNEIEELPVDLVCPKLEIFLLGGMYHQKLKISDECFEGMKALKVLCLKDVDLSLKSLQSLTNLKTLKLIDCSLRDINFLKKLNELEILYLRSSSLDALPRELSELRKLRWLSFDRPDEKLLRLPKLKEVDISSCAQLRQMYQFQTEGLSYTEKENSLANLSPKSHHASFCPALEVLKIHGCFNLTNLIFEVKRQDQKLGVLSLQNLTELNISECHKLQHLFSSTVARNMKQLRELKIERCDELEQIIFEADEEDHLLPEELGVDVRNNREIILLPRLKKLAINELPKLTRFCPAGYHHVWNLETLRIGGLSHDQLSGILNWFKDVKELEIWNCGVTEIEFSAYDIVRVYKCHKLRRIVVPLPTLLQLSDLTIVKCEELEEIIILQDDDEVDIHKDRADDDVTSHHKQLEIVVELPKLECLGLHSLGSLANFCHVNYHFIFPSLKRLRVEGCGKMETRFSYGRGENGRVHVHAEAATEAPKQNIDCYGYEGFQRGLPAYIEKDEEQGISQLSITTAPDC